MKNKGKLSTSLALTAFNLFLILFLSLPLSVAAATPAEKIPFTTTETQITTSGSAERPVIYGNTIILQDHRNGDYGDGTFDGTYDIYMYNLSTSEETLIISPGSAATNPAIYEDKIVWSDDRNGSFRLEKSDIYMYNLSTKQETWISTNGSYSSSPAIYEDRILWTEYNRVHMCNLSTNREISISGNGDAQNPDIYDNWIVWEDMLILADNRISRDIYLYDLSTQKKTRITTNGSANNPAIYGDRIVYEDWRDGNTKIYMYNISSSGETQITTSGCSPAIYENRIVWLDERNGDTDIYMYNISTQREIRITSSESNKEYPEIYGNRIVWEDTFNGSANVYMRTISGDESELKMPVVNFSSNTTGGSPPLTVKFTDLSENATGRSWDFGDGTNSTLQNPEHTYSTEGYYNVRLNVSNEYGTYTKKIGINVRNKANKAPSDFNFLLFVMLVLYLLRK